MQFEDLRLIKPLLRAVRTARYDHPTPIQTAAIPSVLAGKDVLGCAQTGTGKTAAFALPVLQRLSGRAKQPRLSKGGARALVLCPTRELAQQIHESFQIYGRHTDVRSAVVFGGVNQRPQVRALRAGVDILIATPGRLLDLMNQGVASVKCVEMLVLDEADRMLDMGFLPDLRRILRHVPRRRQTLLFSATMPSPIRKLADDILHDPVPVTVARVSSPASSVAHWVYHVEKPGKGGLLLHLVRERPDKRTLVFTRTKHGADKVVKQLVKVGVAAAALHGNKSQGARTRALAEFRSAQTPVLVATDIAARGLDVDDIAQVINYDLTPEPETYIHRIGRTGRAGAAGTAVSFCTSEDRVNLRAIERLIDEPMQCAGEPCRRSDSTSASRRAVPSGADRPRTRRERSRRSPRRRSRGGRASATAADC